MPPLHAFQSWDLPKDFQDFHRADEHDTIEEALDAIDPDTFMNKAAGRSQGVLVVRTLRTRDILPPDALAGLSDAELDGVEREETRTITGSDGYRHSSRGDDSQHAGLVAFQSESEERGALAYAEKRLKQAAKRARRAARAKVVSKVEAEEESAYEAKQRLAKELLGKRIAEERRDAIRTRLRDGFLHTSSKEIAGFRYAPFHEFFSDDVRYRSEIGSPSLARWAQIAPRDARCGTDKAVLMRAATKLFALDAPYVELSKVRLCYLVVDFDSVWESYESFHAALLAILGPDRMPNIITGRRDPSGRFCRPHAFWLLKPEACVWNNLPRTIIDENGVEQHLGDPRCQKRPVQKFWRTLRSLVDLLIPLGADPAMTNIFRPKNPLSPYWQTIVVQDDRWYELDDFASIPGYAQRPDEHAMFERAAKLAAETEGASPKLSNPIWRTVGATIEPMVAEILKTRDFPAGFIDAKRSCKLADWFDARVRPLVEPELAMADDSEEAAAALDAVLQRRCAFAARYINHRLAKPARYRGRDRVAIAEDGLETTKARQSLSSRVTGEGRTTKVMDRMCRELVVVLWTQGEIRKTEAIKSLGMVSPSTAYKHWDEAMKALGLVKCERGVFRRANAVSAKVSDGFRDGAHKIKSQPTSVASINPSARPTVDAVVVEHGVGAHSSGHPVDLTVDRPILVNVDHSDPGIRPVGTVNRASVGQDTDPPWSDDWPEQGANYQHPGDHRPTQDDDGLLLESTLSGALIPDTEEPVIRPMAETLH